MIENILEWAKNEKAIRALALTGSRVVDSPIDPLADYDLALFCSDYSKYTADDGWLSDLGKVWVSVHEKKALDERIFPTRLIIFEGGVKVDFSFYPLETLAIALSNGPYRLLLDKDQNGSLLQPHPKVVEKLTEKEYIRVVKEFWFEAYHVAVCLKREDLWTAKFRAGIANEFLLKMLEWNAKTKYHHGKRMKQWVDEATWKALHEIFAHFDAEGSWKALFNCMNLFRKIATKVAETNHYTYPAEVDKNISTFVLTLSGSP